jgi:hypothetical protein
MLFGYEERARRIAVRGKLAYQPRLLGKEDERAEWVPPSHNDRSGRRPTFLPLCKERETRIEMGHLKIRPALYWGLSVCL